MNTQPTPKNFIVVILPAILTVFIIFFLIMPKVKQGREAEQVQVSSFEECVAVGNPIMESWPRQCRHGQETFVEEIGNEAELADLIRLDSPRPNQEVSSPLEVTGQARGTWFFEGDFPVILTNWDGLIIAEGVATAQGEWMTEEFVPFSAMLEFEDQLPFNNRGSLILQKDNPSGLPENDAALEVPVRLVYGPTPPEGAKKKCQRDDDCVLSKARAYGNACCSTCSDNAINRDDFSRWKQWFHDNCQEENCPVLACGNSDSKMSVPRCKSGICLVERVGK